MKLGVLAASTMIAVAALAPASFAQSSATSFERTMPAMQSGGVARSMSPQVATTTNSVAPTLHSAKPAPGMLPQKPTGPAGRFHRDTSPRGQSSDLRPALNPQ